MKRQYENCICSCLLKSLAQRTQWNHLISIYTCFSTVDFLYHCIFGWGILAYSKASPAINLSRIVSFFFLSYERQHLWFKCWASVGLGLVDSQSDFFSVLLVRKMLYELSGPCLWNNLGFASNHSNWFVLNPLLWCWIPFLKE